MNRQLNFALEPIVPNRPHLRVAVARNDRPMVTLMQERKVMERGWFCFVAWCFATTLWLLLTGPENAWPLTLDDDVASGSLVSATYLGVDATTSENCIGQYGSEGYIIPNSSTNLPNYVQMRVTADTDHVSCRCSLQVGPIFGSRSF
jgi:hypothetical protein